MGTSVIQATSMEDMFLSNPYVGKTYPIEHGIQNVTVEPLKVNWDYCTISMLRQKRGSCSSWHSAELLISYFKHQKGLGLLLAQCFQSREALFQFPSSISELSLVSNGGNQLSSIPQSWAPICTTGMEIARLKFSSKLDFNKSLRAKVYIWNSC